ncbi:MAG: beta-ketoacyl synthase N-terminal-like domain-containing protein [Syntrophales bacterium]
MGEGVFVTGKAMICALGEIPGEMVEAVRRRRINLGQLAFPLAGLPYTRPYYLITRNEGDRPENRPEGYFTELLFATVGRAIADAGLGADGLGQTHLFFGSTSMDVPVVEGKHRRSAAAVSELFLRSSDGYGKIASAVMERFGIGGGSYTFTTACTSSANALLYAATMIGQRRIGRALVIGYDLYNNLGFYGFEGLKSLAAETYRPFDRERDGLILGEACGALLLEAEPRAAGDFCLLGGANLCDVYGVTSHDEEGTAVAETMNRALAQAGVEAADICAVKAHATGTENNDRTECAAMRLTFGGCIPPVTCVKPYIGHTVGACGVCELILFTESLKAGFIPATPGFRQKDDQCDLIPLTEHAAAAEGAYMLNYFGFGGNCTTLILANGGRRR